MTPLEAAVSSENVVAVQVLIDAGANVNLGMVMLLRSWRANINTPGSYLGHKKLVEAVMPVNLDAARSRRLLLIRKLLVPKRR